MRRLLLLSISLIFTFNVFTQSETIYEAGHKIEHYQLQDGIMNSAISDILEDSKGYMWFTNMGFLLKYDGYTIKQYKLEKGPIDNQIPIFMTDLAEDKEGYIWIGTEGLLRFNPQTETFIRIKNEAGKAPFINNLLMNSPIIKDKNGHLWVEAWKETGIHKICLLYTSPSPRDQRGSRMPSSA